MWGAKLLMHEPLNLFHERQKRTAELIEVWQTSHSKIDYEKTTRQQRLHSLFNVGILNHPSSKPNRSLQKSRCSLANNSQQVFEICWHYSVFTISDYYSHPLSAVLCCRHQLWFYNNQCHVAIFQISWSGGIACALMHSLILSGFYKLHVQICSPLLCTY